MTREFRGRFGPLDDSLRPWSRSGFERTRRGPIVVDVPGPVAANHWASCTVQTVAGEEDGSAAATFDDADPDGTIRVLQIQSVPASGAIRLAEPISGYWVAGYGEKPKIQISIRGCYSQPVGTATFRVYTHPGGVLVATGTGSLIRWSGDPLTYRVRIEAPGYRIYDQIFTLPSNVTVHLTPAPGFGCCVPVSACQNPVPADLYLTDGLGTVLMSYQPPPAGPLWFALRWAPVGFTELITPPGTACAGATYGAGDAPLMWILGCPNNAKAGYHVCCWRRLPIDDFYEAYEPVGPFVATQKWTLSLNFWARANPFGYSLLNSDCSQVMPPNGWIGRAPGDWFLNPGAAQQHANDIVRIWREVDPGGVECGPGLSLSFSGFPPTLVPNLIPGVCGYCVSPPFWPNDPAVNHLIRSGGSIVNPIGTSVAISA